jgi:DNA polymerase III alpha subunit
MPNRSRSGTTSRSRRLAGIVRAHEAAKVTGVRVIVGCRLDLADGISILVYPTDRPAYSRLCRLFGALAVAQTFSGPFLTRA